MKYKKALKNYLENRNNSIKQITYKLNLSDLKQFIIDLINLRMDVKLEHVELNLLVNHAVVHNNVYLEVTNLDKKQILIDEGLLVEGLIHCVGGMLWDFDYVCQVNRNNDDIFYSLTIEEIEYKNKESKIELF